MEKWEYLRMYWSPAQGISLGPWGRFGLQWVEDWLHERFPQVRNPRIREFPLRSMHQRYPTLVSESAKGYTIDRLDGRDFEVAMALLEHLGLDGWEAINIDGYWDGEAWFKRPIPESATDSQDSQT